MDKKVILLVLLLFLASCQSTPTPTETNVETMTSTPVETSTPMETNDPELPVEVDLTGLELVEAYESLSFDRPLYITFNQNVPYIVEQTGQIFMVVNQQKEVFLNLTDRVYSAGNEQGLLGFAFDPNYAENNAVYVNYTTRTETVISRFIGNDETILLTYLQPQSNHNGGHLAFGPDGYLYIASGDGGGSGDPQNNAQKTDNLLGKILRIDVSEELMMVPEDNPFGNEIFAYGLRNPWRFSFDSMGRLFVADVGQNAVEEINIVEIGKNYGWHIMEGSRPFAGENSADLVGPIFEYGRSQGASITGGYVYEGTEIPSLHGYYVYGDFMSGKIWALKGATNVELFDTSINISSFGKDEQGELYVVDLGGKIYQIERP